MLKLFSVSVERFRTLQVIAVSTVTATCLLKVRFSS